MYVNTDASLISDNPYYFYSEKSSPRTPDSISKGFSFFKRRNSKGSTGNCSKVAQTKCKSITSASLISDASVLGSPRGSLASIASSSLCSPTIEVHTNSSNSATLRRPNFIQYRERLGSYNESVSYQDNDDVFQQKSQRNHELSRTFPGKCHGTNGLRRHSAGNFSSRDHGSTTSGLISDEVPKMPAPKPPAVTAIRHRKRAQDTCQITNMDDILIITAKHSERAILWANFLKTRFDKITKQRGRKPFNFLHVKIDDGLLAPSLIQTCQTTPLQIVIICPALLAVSQSVLMKQLAAVLNIEKVLGILIEVSASKVLETQREVFPSFRKWRKCEVTMNDQSLIGNILGIATDILGRALCQRPPCQESGRQELKSFNNGDAFTVIPRKVKIGQNKVLALLNEPLTKDDWIKISIAKCEEVVDVMNFKRRNPYTLQFTVPETCMEISTMVEIRIEKNGKSLGCRPVKCESRLRELEQLLKNQDSPLEFMCHSLGMSSTDHDMLDAHLFQCFQKNIPPNFHLLAGAHERANSINFLKDKNPEEYPTLLHFAAKWGFERLAMQLLECPGGDAACEIRNHSGKTPSEMAENVGFVKLAKSLRSFVQMQELTTIYHRCVNYTPQKKNLIEAVEPLIASVEKELTTKLVKSNQILQTEYMEMNSSSSETEGAAASEISAVENLNYINVDTVDSCNLQSTDNIIKKSDSMKIVEGSELLSNELRINEPPYFDSKDSNKPDKFSAECLNVLENCGTTLNSSSQSYYILQPSNKPVGSMIQNQYHTNYTSYPTNRPIVSNNYINNCMQTFEHNDKQGDDSDSHLKLIFEKRKAAEGQKPLNGTLKRAGSGASKGNADDELAEIMYDFKNNVLTIREVEQLVEKWKNRNDVKQSFKEKQEQIEKMREEYDLIQDQLKERLKRPTPFERVKKLFSRSKVNKAQNEENDEMKTSVTSVQSSNQRPTSSLSLQSLSSLSSSGRLSTGSACSGASLGDSGTHSDPEDRRQIYASTCRLGNPGSLLDNYLIPPAPRPVITAGSTTTPTEEKGQLVFTSCNRAVTPGSQSEHYIMFPSNVPVYPSATETHTDQNSPFTRNLNTIIEAKESLNDTSVGVTIQSIKVQNRDAIYSHAEHSKSPKSGFWTSFKSSIDDTKLSTSGSYQNTENLTFKTNEYQNASGSVARNATNKDGTDCQQSPVDNNENHNYINV